MADVIKANTNKQLQKILKQYPDDAEIVCVTEELGGSVPILHIMYEKDVQFMGGTSGTVSFILD